MNPSRFIHSVTGERAPTSFTAGKRDRTWSSTGTHSVLLEGLPARVKVSLVGHIARATYRMSWSGPADIEEGDRITYGGSKYMLHEVTDDTTRPTGAYKTGILARVPD